MPPTSDRPAPSRREFANVAMTALVAPVIGSGAELDRAPRPRYSRRRVELAAALIRPDVAEPRATIYTDVWREARERAARLRPSRGGAVWRRLLDHQERGWRYVRPLAHAVEEAKRAGEAEGATALESAMYRFMDLEVVDLYRFSAFRCADMVLAPHGSDLPSTDDIDGDVDAFYRYVSLLRLASMHRLAPPEFRVLADHAAGLDGWFSEFAGVFEPAANAYHRRLRKLGFLGM